MSFTQLGLETHPVGTGNPNAIINANWARIDALLRASGAYRVFYQALAFDASMSVSLKGAMKRKVNIQGDCAVNLSDISEGYEVELFMLIDGTNRDVVWPGVTWMTALPPSTMPANSKHTVRFVSTGANVADVLAWYI